MNHEERDLSDYIDRLNAGQSPSEESPASAELEPLLKTARMIYGLKEPEMPGEGFPERLSQAVVKELAPSPKIHAVKRRWFVSLTAAAAVFAVFLGLFLLQPFSKGNIVYAMERSYQKVKAYHGILNVTETNAAGQTTTQAQLEVWTDKQQGRYYEKELQGAQQGLVTVNNGQQKWQIQPAAKQATLYPASPDAYQFTFDLGKEIDTVKSAVRTKTSGDAVISGRKTTVLEVTPQGGAPYRLWIDKETNLPLQKQSAMQNSIQYTVTYSEIQFADAIPAQLLTYSLPAGYRQVNSSPEQSVASREEAQKVIGFSPKTLSAPPTGYAAAGMWVNLDTKAFRLRYVSADQAKYADVLEYKAAGALNPTASAMLGKVGGGTAEIQSPVSQTAGILGGGPYAGVTGLNSIRWQQDGAEYAVIGTIPLDELPTFVKALTQETVELPSGSESLTDHAQVRVSVDMTAEENDQKSVDRGSSPWKLDPAYVAQVFVGLKISPQGIQGDYPVAIENFSVTQNTGNEAVVAVSGDKTPIRQVYLKRLVRQDSTGIWTVVGYDPRS